MTNLETLKLRKCKHLVEVHPSLGHCKMLTELDLSGCKKLEKLPKFVSMLSLKILNLRQCTSLKKFPKFSRPMQSLSELLVGSPWMRSLPSYLGELTRLELRKCEVLESIPDTIVQNLKYLEIRGCNKLAMLPPSLEVQSELVNIAIFGCKNLKKLPNSIQMKSLQRLRITGCPKLDTFPEINGDMQRLSYLALQSTAINGELTSSIGNLSGLIELDLNNCKDLVSLPSSICNLKNLRRLNLHYCKKLEKLPENIGDLQQLRVLCAKETAISRLPPSIVKLSKLEHLSLGNCNTLGRLPEDIGSLRSLASLNVCGSNISCLPKSISKLLYLRSLNVQYCTSLSKLSGQLPPNLERLYADDHLAMKSIKDLLIKCVKLNEISFSESKNVHVPASTNQSLLKFLGYFLRTFIQCHFHERQCFHISFLIGGRIPKSFDCNFSINLKPSWYTDNFKGFLICFRGNEQEKLDKFSELTCQLSNPERKHILRYSVFPYMLSLTPSFLSIIYIPYKSFLLSSHCKERKSPKDYCLFEVSTTRNATSWRVYLVYENKGENGLSSAFVPLEPSYASNHLQAYDEKNTATDMLLHWGYEIEADRGK